MRAPDLADLQHLYQLVADLLDSQLEVRIADRPDAKERPLVEGIGMDHVHNGLALIAKRLAVLEEGDGPGDLAVQHEGGDRVDYYKIHFGVSCNVLQQYIEHFRRVPARSRRLCRKYDGMPQ